MITKKVLFGAVQLLLVLSMATVALEWQEIDHGFNAVVVNDLITVGEYQFAAVEGVSQIYRRKIGEDEWTLVHDGHALSKKGPNDRDYGLTAFKDMLFGYRHDPNVGDFKIISYDQGETWDSLTTEEQDLLWSIGVDLIVGDTLISLGWKNKTLEVCIDLEDGFYTRFTSVDEELNVVKMYKGVFYLGGWGRIFKVSDFWEGATVDTLVSGLPGRTDIRDILILDSLQFYASTDEGVYRSTDGGYHWKAVDPQFSATTFSVLKQLTYCDSSVYGMSKNRVYRLSPSDSFFKEIPMPLDYKYGCSKISVFNNQICIAGFDGVYEYNATTNHVTLINKGLERLPRISDIDVSDSLIYATTYNVGGYRSLLKGVEGRSHWDTIFTAKCNILNFRNNDNYLRVSIGDEGEEIYFYSDNYGATWEEREKTKNPLHNGVLVEVVNDTMYCKGDYEDNFPVLYSIDQGQTWDTLLTFDNSDTYYCFKLGTRMFFARRVSPPKQSPYLMYYYSDDNGKTTHDIPGIGNMSSLHKGSNGTIIAGGYRKVAYSKDSGETWTYFDSLSVSGVFSLSDSVVLGINKIKLGKFHTGTKNRYFYSTNYGESWNTLPQSNGEGTLSAFYTGAEVERNTSTIYCAEAGHLYKIPAEELTKGVSVIHTEKMTKSGQNLFVPNLTSNTIRLQLHMAKDEQYTVNLLTASGRLIQSSNGIIQSNTQAISLDRSGLSHGYYLLQLIAGDRKEVRPIILQ